MKISLYILIIIFFSCGTSRATPPIVVDQPAIERGMKVFMESCRLCHSLKYYRDRAHPDGIKPLMDEAGLKEGFGVVPPDLSLIAAARGRGTEGARYIYRLLTTYYEEDGLTKNRAFAEWTGGDGTIAMPPPLPEDGLESKAQDVAAFLYYVADPKEAERERLGVYVLVYTVVMTILLYLIYRRVWKGVKKVE